MDTLTKGVDDTITNEYSWGKGCEILHRKNLTCLLDKEQEQKD